MKPMNNDDILLTVENLTVGFANEKGGVLTAVDGVSFQVRKGRTLGIVGESGSGKSVTAFSLMRLLPRPAGRILGGKAMFKGRDLTALPIADMRTVRGREIAMVFQEPMTALNPLHTVGRQLKEVFELHTDLPSSEIDARCLDLLRKVGIPAPEQRMKEYPHKLSGGMRQRVVIAMALALRPDLLICDEPTTALDVTIQAQILELIKSLQTEYGMSGILITHDLGVIAENCDDVAVMYAGRIVEIAPPKSKLETIEGIVPGLADLKPGCRFAPRSGRPYTEEDLTVRPPFLEVSPGHWVEGSRVCVDAGVLASARR
jgi:peptide/nickel transport system ATP-binding protein